MWWIQRQWELFNMTFLILIIQVTQTRLSWYWTSLRSRQLRNQCSFLLTLRLQVRHHTGKAKGIQELWESMMISLTSMTSSKTKLIHKEYKVNRCYQHLDLNMAVNQHLMLMFRQLLSRVIKLQKQVSIICHEQIMNWKSKLSRLRWIILLKIYCRHNRSLLWPTQSMI